jgi:hypothetical protein
MSPSPLDMGHNGALDGTKTRAASGGAASSATYGCCAFVAYL